MAKRTVHVAHPKHDHIIIEKLSEAEYNADGHIDNNRFFAKVKAVGPGKILPNGERAPMSVKVGDVLLIWGGVAQTKYEGRELYSIQDEAVFAVIGPDTEEFDDGTTLICVPKPADLADIPRIADPKLVLS